MTPGLTLLRVCVVGRLNFEKADNWEHAHNVHIHRSQSSITPGQRRSHRQDNRHDSVNINHRNAFTRHQSYPATENLVSDDADTHDYVNIVDNIAPSNDNARHCDDDGDRAHDYVNVDKFMKRLKEDINNDNFVWPPPTTSTTTSGGAATTTSNDFALLGRGGGGDVTTPTSHRAPTNDNHHTPLRRTSSIKFNVDFSATTV